MAKKSKKSKFIKDILAAYKANRLMDDVTINDIKKRYGYDGQIINTLAPTSIVIYNLPNKELLKNWFLDNFARGVTGEDLTEAKTTYKNAQKASKGSGLLLDANKRDYYEKIVSEFANLDDSKDYSLLYKSLNLGTPTPPVTIGKLISEIGSKILTHLDTKQNNAFAIPMVVALIAKAGYKSNFPPETIQQIMDLEQTLAPYMAITISDGVNINYIQTIASKTLEDMGYDKSTTRNLCETLTTTDQIFTKILSSAEWNCSFYGENQFLTFDEQGLTTNYFQEDDLEYEDKSVDNLIKDMFQADGSISKKHAYSIIQKVAAHVTGLPTDKPIDLSKLNKIEILTILISAQNIFGTIECDDKAKETAMQELATVLALPITEITSFIDKKDRILICEKVDDVMTALSVNGATIMSKQLKSTDPYKYARSFLQRLIKDKKEEANDNAAKAEAAGDTVEAARQRDLDKRYSSLGYDFTLYGNAPSIKDDAKLQHHIRTSTKIHSDHTRSLYIGMAYCSSRPAVPTNATEEASYKANAEAQLQSMLNEYGNAL